MSSPLKAKRKPLLSHYHYKVWSTVKMNSYNFSSQPLQFRLSRFKANKLASRIIRSNNS
nr:MAG TPA: hypothetical protein [Caudoviricetes sp.]